MATVSEPIGPIPTITPTISVAPSAPASVPTISVESMQPVTALSGASGVFSAFGIPPGVAGGVQQSMPRVSARRGIIRLSGVSASSVHPWLNQIYAAMAKRPGRTGAYYARQLIKLRRI